ncbi:MAG: 4-carboxymuconolactone decarboxylase [Paracoccaceae bacterium]|jgi:4-carboxymuconolactone decarboxylase
MDRNANRDAGAAHRRGLGQPDSDPGLNAPGYKAYVDEYFHNDIGARDILPLADRMIPALTALCFRGAAKATERMVGAALDAGLDARAILEIFIQSALYSGLPRTDEAIEIAGRVFAARGIDLPDDPPDDRSVEEMDADGAAVMEELHGARQAGGYASPDNPVTFSLYQGAIRHGYGQLWVRPGLDLRQRMICAIAGFTSASLHASLTKFSVSALNVGLSKDQVAEAAIQTAPWNGLPIALTGLTVISDALAAAD